MNREIRRSRAVQYAVDVARRSLEKLFNNRRVVNQPAFLREQRDVRNRRQLSFEKSCNYLVGARSENRRTLIPQRVGIA